MSSGIDWDQITGSFSARKYGQPDASFSCVEACVGKWREGVGKIALLYGVDCISDSLIWLNGGTEGGIKGKESEMRPT